MFNNPPPAGDLDVNLWADAERRPAAHEHPGADDRDGARGHRVGGLAHRGLLDSRRRDACTIPSLGFNLAGTITRPQGRPRRCRRVILIGGSGPTDRDETVAGIPVFGQLARDLVDAGFVVVRYDKRGVGQSGGRAESATIADYAEDARQVVLWLEKQQGRRQGPHRASSATARARWWRC